MYGINSGLHIFIIRFVFGMEEDCMYFARLQDRKIVWSIEYYWRQLTFINYISMLYVSFAMSVCFFAEHGVKRIIQEFKYSL